MGTAYILPGVKPWFWFRLRWSGVKQPREAGVTYVGGTGNWCVAPTLWQFPSKSVAALNKLKVITLSVLLDVLDFPETPRWLSPPVSSSSGISRWVVACVAGSGLSWVAGSDRATQQSQPCNSSSNFQQPTKNYHEPSRDQPYSFTILSCSFLRLLSVFCRCLCHLLKIKDNKKIQ